MVFTTEFFAKSITLIVPEPSFDTNAKGVACERKERLEDKSKEVIKYFFIDALYIKYLKFSMNTK